MWISRETYSWMGVKAAKLALGQADSLSPRISAATARRHPRASRLNNYLRLASVKLPPRRPHHTVAIRRQPFIPPSMIIPTARRRSSVYTPPTRPTATLRLLALHRAPCTVHSIHVQHSNISTPTATQRGLLKCPKTAHKSTQIDYERSEY